MAFVPTRWGKALANLQRVDVELRLLVLVLLIVATGMILRVWDPPFPYHVGTLVDRDIVARVNFQVYNPEETLRQRELAKSRVLYIFEKKPAVTQENMDLLRSVLNQAINTKVDNFEQLPPDIQEYFKAVDSQLTSAADAQTDSGKFWKFLRSGREKHSAPEPEKAAPAGAAPASLVPGVPAVETGAAETLVLPLSSGPAMTVPALQQKKALSGDENETPPDTARPSADEVPSTSVNTAADALPQPAIAPAPVNPVKAVLSPGESPVISTDAGTDSPEEPAQASGAVTPEEVVGVHPGETLPVESTRTEMVVTESGAAVEEVPQENPLDAFMQQLAAVLAPFADRGMLHAVAPQEDRDPLLRGMPTTIKIRENTNSAEPRLAYESEAYGASPGSDDAVRATIWRKVEMQDLFIETNTRLLHALQEELGKEIGRRIFYFICNRHWKANLEIDIPATKQAIREAEESVQPYYTQYERSQRVIPVGAGNGQQAVTSISLTPADITLLRAENTEWLKHRTSAQRFYRTVAALFVLLAMITPTVCFITLTEPQIVAVWRRLLFVVGLTLVALAAALALSTGLWRFTLLPIVLYSQMITIQYNRKVGLVAGLMLAILTGFGMAVPMTELLMYFGVLLVSVLPVDRIRGRLQFVKIGLGAGATAFLLSYSNDMLSGQPVDNFYTAGASYATVNFLQLLLGGFLVQGMMPLLERWLGILSDARLMELCDQSNPLLSELIDRAPSTYSHSMAVGAIGERAAEAIRCDGLLVRAASYYHDIGKIYKPDYYAENQSLTGVNHHLELEPTMSALIIIAHIKNGVDIAKQYKLPEKIVDIIEQHHGTTLVKYFYSQAVQKSGASPDHSPVDESTFSYPGPKPQTKEAVIVMLADCCESACRTIVDPTPKRIEGLVSKIVQERLEEGQFDESGMTLRELRTVEDSIVKSLISNYHGRIKYPEMKKEEKKS